MVSGDDHKFSSSRKLAGPADYSIDGSENAFVGRPLNLRVRMLLKSAVSTPEKGSISRKRKVNVDENIERLWFYTSYTRV